MFCLNYSHVETHVQGNPLLYDSKRRYETLNDVIRFYAVLYETPKYQRYVQPNV
jgi:hypothetical protein